MFLMWNTCTTILNIVMFICLGFTIVLEKNLLILVTDVGKFICMYFSIIKSEVNYSLKIVDNNFSEQVQNYTCTSVVFSKNGCICALAFQ